MILESTKRDEFLSSDNTLDSNKYRWPQENFFKPTWQSVTHTNFKMLELAEDLDGLLEDSRWPAFFPSSICIVTTKFGKKFGVEKVVGASIVNRFPYIVALSFCNRTLSSRHYARHYFINLLEHSKSVAIQFLFPNINLHKIIDCIEKTPPEHRYEYILDQKIPMELGVEEQNPIFSDSFLIYEASLKKTTVALDGNPIFENYFKDIGSHRIYFLEINRIHLNKDISDKNKKIYWKSLPTWTPLQTKNNYEEEKLIIRNQNLKKLKYVKQYNPHYFFPSLDTINFNHNEIRGARVINSLPPVAAEQIEVDNDKARWPCFFPSSLGIITLFDLEGRVSAMPCGSTTIVSRFPLVISICVSYSRINERYAPRKTLDFLFKQDYFGCGVPYIDQEILEAINYLGNISYREDNDKFYNSGLTAINIGNTPLIEQLPIHFDCKIINKIPLGTHIMFFGEVKNIFLRNDVTFTNPFVWNPYTNVISCTS